MNSKSKKKDEKNNKGLVLGICSIFSGIMIPLLGLILGIIGLVRSEEETPRILNALGIFTSVVFWVLWAIFL